MDGDYIELADTGADPESIARTLVAVLEPESVTWHESGLLHLALDARSFVFVEFAPGGPWAARLAIGDTDDHEPARRRLAERVYRRLEPRLGGQLRWTSDGEHPTRSQSGALAL